MSRAGSADDSSNVIVDILTDIVALGNRHRQSNRMMLPVLATLERVIKDGVLQHISDENRTGW